MGSCKLRHDGQFSPSHTPRRPESNYLMPHEQVRPDRFVAAAAVDSNSLRPLFPSQKCMEVNELPRLLSVDFEGGRQDIRLLRILFLLTGAIGDRFGRFRLVKCQPDGERVWIEFWVGLALLAAMKRALLLVAVMVGTDLGCSAPIPAGISFPLRFDGFIEIGNERRFAVASITSEGVLRDRRWLELRQCFGEYFIFDYDAKNEVLLVRDSQTNIHRLPLVSSKVREARGTEVTPFVLAMSRVEQMRADTRKKWNVPPTFSIDIDGGSMPTDVRGRFYRFREREETGGGYLVGVCVDGQWIFSRFKNSGDEKATNHLVPRSLDPSERTKVEIAWALALAERAGYILMDNQKKGIPPPKP